MKMSRNGKPGLVSVVIPTYFRNEWLDQAIESVLAQTYDPIEIIVVDDSGEQFAAQIATRYDVHYIAHEQNRGSQNARNSGIEAASGDYIQLLDDDDRILPTKIEQQVDILESNPSVGVVFCGLRQENGIPKYPRDSQRGDVLKQALRLTDLHPCQTTTMLFDGDLLRTLFPLAQRIAADDIGLKIRAASCTTFEFVDDLLVEKGNPSTHRLNKLGFGIELLEIIDEFEHLYDRFEEDVRHDATAIAYRNRGHRLMLHHGWSREAIESFIRAFRLSRTARGSVGVAILAALFGRPAYLGLWKIKTNFAKNRNHIRSDLDEILATLAFD